MLKLYIKIAIIISIALTVGCSTLQTVFRKTPSTPSDVYERAVSTIERNYIDPEGKPIKLDTSNAPNIGSLMSQLTSSSLITPEEAVMLQNPFIAQTGIALRIRGEKLKVIGSYSDSPAFQADINYDDEIIEIDYQSVENLTPLRLENLLLGSPGSEVSIKILKRDKETKIYKLIREVIKVEDCVGERIIQDGIGYIHLRHFDRKTPDNLKSAVKRLLKKGMVALVLDMRGNSGGLLSAINEASQLFVESGKSMSKMVGNNSTQTFDSHGWSHYIDFPMAILIDMNTGAGAEIMSAALQENKRAILVGDVSQERVDALVDALRSEFNQYGIGIDVPWVKEWERPGFWSSTIMEDIVIRPLQTPCDRLFAFVSRNAGDFLWGIIMPEVLGMVDSTTFTKGFAVAEWGSLNQMLPPVISPDDATVHEAYHLLGCEHALTMTKCYEKIQRLKEVATKERNDGSDFFPSITKEGKILRTRNDVENEFYQLVVKNIASSQTK